MNHSSLGKATCEIDRHNMNLYKYDLLLMILNIRHFFFLKAEFKELLHKPPYYIEVHSLYILLFYLKCRVPFEILKYNKSISLLSVNVLNPNFKFWSGKNK